MSRTNIWTTNSGVRSNRANSPEANIRPGEFLFICDQKERNSY